jgi:integrase
MNDIHPDDALDLYLDDRRKTAAQSTIDSHEDRLSWFVTWFFEETEYDHLHELDGLDIRQWRVWRFDDDHTDAYIESVQDLLRVVLRFCRDIEAVDAQLPEKVNSPDGGFQRSAEIPASRARTILGSLDEYASLPHALVRVLWYCLLRVGGACALDLDDLDRQNGQPLLRHRPDEGTPSKSGAASERNIALRPKTVTVFDDYVDNNRVDVTDEHGRRPLFVMPRRSKRAHRNGLRQTVYA